MINFRDVYADNQHSDTRSMVVTYLYGLLQQRPPMASISHKVMPSLEEHRAFVASHPYRYWYLVVDARTDTWVGAIYATYLNALGIAIHLEHRRNGYALAAMQTFIKTHKPLEGRPSVRTPNWCANVAMENDPSHNLFHRLGKPIQVTYEIAPCA